MTLSWVRQCSGGFAGAQELQHLRTNSLLYCLKNSGLLTYPDIPRVSGRVQCKKLCLHWVSQNLTQGWVLAWIWYLTGRGEQKSRKFVPLKRQLTEICTILQSRWPRRWCNCSSGRRSGILSYRASRYFKSRFNCTSAPHLPLLWSDCEWDFGPGAGFNGA